MRPSALHVVALLPSRSCPVKIVPSIAMSVSRSSELLVLPAGVITATVAVVVVAVVVVVVVVVVIVIAAVVGKCLGEFNKGGKLDLASLSLPSKTF